VNIGNAAKMPICILFAPNINAREMRKAPPLNAVIASAASPSQITKDKPFFISSWVNVVLGDNCFDRQSFDSIFPRIENVCLTGFSCNRKHASDSSNLHSSFYCQHDELKNCACQDDRFT
jgi:hypothetical protein